MNTGCLKEYAKYTSLNVLGMIGLSCYILADTFFVSKGLGSNGLAALNLAIPVYSFIHGTGLMLGMGGATRYSMVMSQQKGDKGNEVFSHTMVLALGFAVLFVVMGLFFTDSITMLLGADEAVFEMCRTYLKVLLIFSPMFLLNEILLCFVRNDGEPQLPMVSMLAGSFSNIVLDYVFIFPLGMGIFGAVFATGLAPVVSLIILSRFFRKKRNRFRLVRCRLSGIVIGHIFGGGIPSLAAEVSSGIVMIVFNTIILGLQGNIGVAAYGVIANLSLVVLAVYTGIGQGIQPVISKYYGMGNGKNIQAVFKYAVCTVAVLSGLIYFGIFCGAGPIAAIFNSEGNEMLQAIAVQGMKIYFTACVFAGVNIVLSVYFTSTDKVKPANLISLLRGFILVLPLALLLPEIWGMTGLWLVFPLTEMLVAVLALLLYIHSKKPKNI